MKVIDTREYVSVLRELVHEGKEVSMMITGSSMSPFLIHQRDMIVFKAPDRGLRRGDMVFYQRDDGRFVMHRIYKIGMEGFYMLGDAQIEIEGPLRRDQIFALIVKVRRKNKWYQEGDFLWEFFADSWIKLLPIRKVLIKLYTFIDRVKNKRDKKN